MRTDKPFVLCVSGLDPTGGAGIQADIETLQALGCHALPIVSSLTVQTTSNVRQTNPVDAELICSQFEALLDSGLDIAAVKLGLIDSPHTLRGIADILARLPGVPVIADPVLKAGGGFEINGADMVQRYRELILPLCKVLTPNTEELQRLSPATGTEQQALDELCSTGCEYILLTGTHRPGGQVVNRLYGKGDGKGARAAPALDHQWTWPRLAGDYHGSGCTLAAALAAGIATGSDLQQAAMQAQQFTWSALEGALRTGNGQYLPNRQRLQP